MIYVVYYNKNLRKEFGVLKEAKIFAEQNGANKIFAYSATGIPMNGFLYTRIGWVMIDNHNPPHYANY